MIAEMVDRVAVMYAGRIVEQADTTTLFDHALHPYTKGLIASIPVLGNTRPRLEVILGGGAESETCLEAVALRGAATPG